MSKQRTHQEELFEETEPQGPVECLGMTFENDEVRRAYFLDKLREKLTDPEFRKIEGFPIGEDEDILRLSDPPYYTACPNPFLKDFFECYSTPYDPQMDKYRREPFATDVSEGKNDPIYNAHSYHTKVPHKAIMHYILHYTEPGDIVFDGFCGTGMTGVAAQLCGDRKAIQDLGYKIQDDGIILDTDGKPFSKLGFRRAVLNDLSPAATFIAYNYNTPVNVTGFKKEAERILGEIEKECGWMYLTLHQPKPGQIEKEISELKINSHLRIQDLGAPYGHINYTVWSDVFICPECVQEVRFWDVAVNKEDGEVRQEFHCPHCSARITKRTMDRAWEAKFDKTLNKAVRQTKQVPVLINYSSGKKRFEKIPDAFDLDIIKKIEDSEIPYWTPNYPMMFKGERWGDSWRAGIHSGITHVHHFYTRRNLRVFASLYRYATNPLIQCALLGGYTVGLKTARFLPLRWVNKDTGPMKPHTAGTLYVPSLCGEQNWMNIFLARTAATVRASQHIKEIEKGILISCGSSSCFFTPDKSLDYIFIDPPFGGNLMYSELNFIWESWLKTFTNNEPEAIENKTQGKNLFEYQELLIRCCQEFYRILKPGRWMTIEFHNSKNSVWNAIQEALQHAGFIIADVRTLDKKQGTFKQVTSRGAVKQDLIISAYKPNGGLEERFKIEAGTEEGAWDFVKTHLRQLPVFVLSKDGQAEAIAERQNYLLFDRMVAFHVQRGVAVPLSAAEFYAGLKQHFSEREGMYFLPEQAAEYDKKRLTVKELLQLELAPSDESSAIQWLRQQLTRKPQTFQELHPQFMKVIAGWGRHEKPLELSDLLKENFLCCNSSEPTPAQVVSWMKHSAELRELIRTELAAGHATEDNGALSTRHPALLSRAQARWYVPDPNKAQDLEKLRERNLLKEFEEYSEIKQKKLKIFRLEAVRAGFKKAWQERDYQTIIDIAGKISEQVLQEDPKLLMWYDQALTRTDKTV